MNIEISKTLVDKNFNYFTVFQDKIVKSNIVDSKDSMNQLSFLKEEKIIDSIIDSNNVLVLLIKYNKSFFIRKVNSDLVILCSRKINNKTIKSLCSITNDKENNYVLIGSSFLEREGLLIKINQKGIILNLKTWDYSFKQIVYIDNFFFIIADDRNKSIILKIDDELNIEDKLEYEDEFFFFNFIIKKEKGLFIVIGRIIDKDETFKIYESVHFTISTNLEIKSIMYCA